MNEDYYKKLRFPRPPVSNGSYIFELIFGAFFIGIIASIFLFIIGLNVYAVLHFFKIIVNLTEPNIILIAIIFNILVISIYSYFAIKWYKRRNVEHEQQVYDSWLEERLEFYTQLKSKMSELQLNPILYIDQITNQYEHQKGGMARFSLILFVFFSLIMFPAFILNPTTNLMEIILIELMIFISIFGVTYLAGFLEPIMNKLFSFQDPYRHMARALKTANINLLIIEVKRFEDSEINIVSGENSKNVFGLSLFWFFKAELFILNGDIFYANQILTNLRKTVQKNLALLGEIDLLLASNYINSDKEDQALELFQEAQKIFTKNKITEPLSMINERILFLKSKEIFIE